MLARPGPRAPTRFQRAVALAVRLRAGLGDIPAGVASLSDWILPHAFPTDNERVFAATVTGAIGVNRPRPQLKSRNATDFSALITLGLGNFYGEHAKRRLAILLSDGESREFSLPLVLEALRRGHVGLILVRFWSRHDAVYLGRRRDPGYVPNPEATAPLERLAARTAGGRVFRESEPGAVIRAARSFLGKGPVVGAGRKDRTLPLGPYAVLAGILPLAFLLRRR
jgi:hypothetical protein